MATKKQASGRPELRYHGGIRIDSIPVKGIAGLIFAVGVLCLFLLGVPASRSFLAITIPGGVIAAGILYYWRNR